MAAGTWEALESDSVPRHRSTWGVEDFHLVGRAGTHDHGLRQHASHLGRLQVAHQHSHAILHLHRVTMWNLMLRKEKTAAAHMVQLMWGVNV